MSVFSYLISRKSSTFVADFKKRKNMGKETKFCQSCGMTLTDDVLGTNADGSKNEDYCMYCYKDGKFLQECTMDEMIEHCSQFVDEVNGRSSESHPSSLEDGRVVTDEGEANKQIPKPMTKEEYKQMMRGFFPMLKRWRR